MRKSHLLYLLALTMFLPACNHKKSDAAAAESVPQIDVAVPETDSVVVTQKYPGVVESDGDVEVVARVDGTLLRKCFRDGQNVSKGQVLFQIESTRYANAVREAEASLASARSQVEFYRNQHAAMQRALKSDAVARINVIEAESNLKEAEASVKNALATLSDARTQLGYCTVRAPISGQVTESSIDEGSFVSGNGSTTLCRIVNNNNLKVSFSIDDVLYQNLLSQGIGKASAPLYKNVPIMVGNDAKSSFTTDLYYISPSVATTTGQLTLEGKIKDPTASLRDGMYVSVNLPTGVDPHAVLVKDASIGTDQLGKFLYVVNDSNKVEYRSIKTGQLYQDTLRVVVSGIKPGEKYVTKALLSVRAGMKIKPRLTH